MKKRPSPLDYWGTALQIGWVMAEAQAVIAMRLMGMAGLWSVPKSENRRMVSEKVRAVCKGWTDASLAALGGRSPDQIAAAAITPVRRATRANARRLGKRGLRR